MKIQAQDVKVGMTVGWGVVTLTVERIETYTQKNGTECKTFWGKATMPSPRGFKPTSYEKYDFTAKNETWLTLKG